MNDKKKLEHDFTNNSIRIDVLNRLIIEKIEKSTRPDLDHIQDLNKFLKIHLELVSKLIE